MRITERPSATESLDLLRVEALAAEICFITQDAASTPVVDGLWRDPEDCRDTPPREEVSH